MQPEPGSPADWLEEARSDLALAESRSDRPVKWAHRCFHLQQAAEKAVKAVLVSHGIDPPRTHNIGTLLDRLSGDMPTPPSAEAIGDLSRFAAVTRYPGSYEPITEEHYREALHLAEAVVRWAEEVIGRGAQA